MSGEKPLNKIDMPESIYREYHIVCRITSFPNYFVEFLDLVGNENSWQIRVF